MTQPRLRRHRRYQRPLDTVEMLRMRRAIRHGEPPFIPKPELIAAADQARAVYREHRDEVIARMEAEERDGKVPIAAGLVAMADTDELTRARARQLRREDDL